MHSIFQEHALSAPDVCNNCFRRVREEREQRSSTGQATVELSPYTRDETTTEIDSTPFGTPTRSTAIWCDCGVDSAYERIWDDGDEQCLTMHRFKTLLRRAIETLEAKDITLSRDVTVRIALQRYRDDHAFNDALEAAVNAGVHHSAASQPRSKAAPLSD